MSTFVVHSNTSHSRSDALINLLAERGRKAIMAQSLENVRKQLDYGKGRSLVFVPDPSGDTALADETIRFAEAESRGTFVVYVSDTMSADSYKRLVRANAGEWIKWDGLEREIGDIFASDAAAQAEASSDGATIVSFLPAKGGVGNTTLALETGVYLASAKKSDRRVAVLDFNFQSSTLADCVDLEPRFDITEFADRPERLDAQLVNILSNKHSPHLDIFSSPPRLASSQGIQAEVIFAILDEIGRKYDFVLLDLPNHWHSWFDNVLQGSSAVVITGEGTVPSIKQVANKQKHLDELAIANDRAAIIVNSCGTNFLGRISRRSEIDKTFSGRQIFYVPRDTNSAAEAANTGRPIMETAPNRSIGKSIKRVGSWIEALRTQSGRPS